MSPICLPVLTYGMSNSKFVGTKATVSGWGLHTFEPVVNGHGPYAQRLKKLADNDVMTNYVCQSLWAARQEEYGFTSIVDAMICTNKVNSSACFGDSGGLKINFTCSSI